MGGFGLGSLAFGGLGGLLSNPGAPSGPGKLAKFMQAQQAMNYAQALKAMKASVGDINQGYGAAISNANLGAAQSKADIQDLQKQAIGAETQGAMNKGLYNSTAASSANRGVYADAMRQMGQVNQNLANNLSQLQMAKANALSGAKGNLANFWQQKSGAETAMNQNFWNAMPKSAPPNPLLGGLGALGGSFLSSYMGGIGSGLASMSFNKPPSYGGGFIGPTASGWQY